MSTISLSCAAVCLMLRALTNMAPSELSRFAACPRCGRVYEPWLPAPHLQNGPQLVIGTSCAATHVFAGLIPFISQTSLEVCLMKYTKSLTGTKSIDSRNERTPTRNSIFLAETSLHVPTRLVSKTRRAFHGYRGEAAATRHSGRSLRRKLVCSCFFDSFRRR